MGEVIEQTLNESTQQASTTPSCARRAARLKLESDMDQVLLGKADLAYEIAVDVIPTSSRWTSRH